MTAKTDSLTVYRCFLCDTTHGAYEWNRHTAYRLYGGDKWADQNPTGFGAITPIEKFDGKREQHGGRGGSGTFFHCPNCDVESYSHQVAEEVKPFTNSAATFLLSQVMPDE